MTFTRRHITLTFQLGKGIYGTSGYDQVTVEGLRVSAAINNVVGPGMSTAYVKVYGLTLDLMNQLSISTPTIRGRFAEQWANMLIAAGDDDSGMSTIFQGQITFAPINMNSAPQSCLEIVGMPGAFIAAQPGASTSYPGSASVAGILQGLAQAAGFTFENNGVTAQLSTPVLTGPIWGQIKSVATAADINFTIDNGKLIIWPKGGTRNGDALLISAETGMIGYPTSLNIGVEVRTLFNPSLEIGRRIQVQSSLTFANGVFTAYDVQHDIESETPNGRWQTQFHGAWIGG